MLSFFPRGVLDGILNLIESVSEGFPSYSSYGSLNVVLAWSVKRIAFKWIGTDSTFTGMEQICLHCRCILECKKLIIWYTNGHHVQNSLHYIILSASINFNRLKVKCVLQTKKLY